MVIFRTVAAAARALLVFVEEFTRSQSAPQHVFSSVLGAVYSRAQSFKHQICPSRQFVIWISDFLLPLSHTHILDAGRMKDKEAENYQLTYS